MSSRQRGNAVSCFLVNGIVIEGVENVRRVVFSYFSYHFKSCYVERPSMESLQFPSL